ncbi:hypothetical protein Hneap_1203 [Halothiobacillus neapolitanus c2]|uniref:Uncharacterized protein n=1 Tax=Halothiobacillus neapolitanus (strain ATCC 23641 / DSM 15147 / CIP 104769 / NCIMB 8539 / c2) TaxID=555778 RepID=D0L016_HALNC|nr:hypothetical protein Hneap_1203 [Halothiobacillus neapolitanus c2]TDN66347.1 hypothetical protein C8D83_101679 [Halothiobacillus neapolitanus]
MLGNTSMEKNGYSRLDFFYKTLMSYKIKMPVTQRVHLTNNNETN